MDFFEKLGNSIESLWRSNSYDEDAFPGIAEAALIELPPDKNVGTYAPLVGLLDGRYPEQPFQGDMQFGEPPVRVYDDKRFYIEALYWLDGTTAVHEHGFNGAFHVMSGSSIHCRYSFQQRRRYNSQLKVGQVHREFIELLSKGSTRQILPAQTMTHSLFHLERPSVTVVVRTHHVPGSDPQYSYLLPGIAFDPMRGFREYRSHFKALSTLSMVKHPEFAQIATRTLKEADPYLFVSLGKSIGRLFADEAAFREALEAARETQGTLVDDTLAVMTEEIRQGGIVHLRSKLRSHEHRFFLALLLHFDQGQELLQFVSSIHPHEDPRDLVLRWMTECGSSPDPDAPAKAVLNLKFDSSVVDVMRHMLAGTSFDALMDKIAGEFDAEDLAAQKGNVRRLFDGLRNHQVFGTLFR